MLLLLQENVFPSEKRHKITIKNPHTQKFVLNLVRKVIFVGLMSVFYYVSKNF